MRATRKEMRDLARQVYKLEFDESSGKYYYANVKTGEATWSKPLIMGSEDIEFDYGSIHVVIAVNMFWEHVLLNGQNIVDCRNGSSHF